MSQQEHAEVAEALSMDSDIRSSWAIGTAFLAIKVVGLRRWELQSWTEPKQPNSKPLVSHTPSASFSWVPQIPPHTGGAKRSKNTSCSYGYL